MKLTGIRVVPSPSHPTGFADLTGYARTANRKARRYAAARTPFIGSNLYGVQQGNVYVVYSYGPHWPLALYDDDAHCWYSNEGEYSPSTSRHAHHLGLHLHAAHTRSVGWFTQVIAAGGVVEAVSDRFALAA